MPTFLPTIPPKFLLIARCVTLSALCVCCAGVTGLRAQPRTADPAKRGVALTEFPRFVNVADNVYGYEEIRQPGFTTVSLIVVGKNGVLIADGQGSVPAMQTMLDKIKTITTLPVKWYVVGSDHGDHTAGNSVLPPGITYVVHPFSKMKLQGDGAQAAAMTSDRETIDVGGMSVNVLFLGRAHTGGDLNVELPTQKILFMSEVYLNRVFPAMRSAYPSEWVKTVDKALAMKEDRYIAGHGFIETPAASREELVAFRGALVAVIAEVKRLHDMGLTVDEAIKQANWGAYREWFIADQQGPIAVKKMYEELDGKLK